MTACASCGDALGAQPLYSPDGDLVCDARHRASTARDAVQSRAQYLAWASLTGAVVSFVINSGFVVSVGAVLGGIAAFRSCSRLPGPLAAPIRRRATFGIVLALVSTALALRSVLFPPVAPPTAADHFRNGQTLERAGRVQEARTAYSTACDRNVSAGCQSLAESFAAEHKHTVARIPMEKACKMKNRRACYLLGNFHDSGYFGAPDADAALRFYSRACTLGEQEACRAAQLLQAGE